MFALLIADCLFDRALRAMLLIAVDFWLDVGWVELGLFDLF